MIQRIVLYATLGTLCSVLGYSWDSPEFLCLLGLFWACDLVGRQAGFEVGVVQGMSAYSQANEQQRADIDKIVKDNKNND